MTVETTSCCDCGEATDRGLAYHTGCCPHADVNDTDGANNGSDFHWAWYVCDDCGADLFPGEDGWETL